VDVECSETGEIEYFLWEDLSEGGNDREIGMVCREGLSIFWPLERSWLPDGDTVG
jgi:hypothetical protein